VRLNTIGADYNQAIIKKAVVQKNQLTFI